MFDVVQFNKKKKKNKEQQKEKGKRTEEIKNKTN